MAADVEDVEARWCWVSERSWGLQDIVERYLYHLEASSYRWGIAACVNGVVRTSTEKGRVLDPHVPWRLPTPNKRALIKYSMHLAPCQAAEVRPG